MNTNQLAEEMQRVQTEYAANPTPENLAKMQNEMLRLQQEMMAASMQEAAAAMTGTPDTGSFFADAMAEAQAATDYGQALGQVMGDLLGGDDEDEQALAEFIAAHPPAAGKAKYLPVGAFLLNTNGEPYQVFAMNGDRDAWLEAMSDDWDIEDAQAGREMLESLLQGRHTQVFDGDYLKYKTGQPHELDEESVEAFEEMLEMISEAIPELLPFAQSCETILAWDLERAGYLARIFAHLGWISGDESLDWLEKTAERIKQVFNSWEEYAVSVAAGRALHFESADSVIMSACELFDEDNDFLVTHPFSDLCS